MQIGNPLLNFLFTRAMYAQLVRPLNLLIHRRPADYLDYTLGRQLTNNINRNLDAALYRRLGRRLSQQLGLELRMILRGNR